MLHLIFDDSLYFISFSQVFQSFALSWKIWHVDSEVVWRVLKSRLALRRQTHLTRDYVTDRIFFILKSCDSAWFQTTFAN